MEVTENWHVPSNVCFTKTAGTDEDNTAFAQSWHALSSVDWHVLPNKACTASITTVPTASVSITLASAPMGHLLLVTTVA